MNQNLGEFLGRLGLTEYEAKTLSTLFALQEAETPEVARVSQVPKTRVYDVLDGLVEKGLVVKIFSRPKRYRCLKPTEVFQKLIQEKQTELEEWGSNAFEIAKDLESQRPIREEKGERVHKVKSRTDFYKILAQELDTAQTEIKGLTILDAHHHLLHDTLQHAAQRNVSIQFTGEHPESFVETAEKWGKNVQLKKANHGLHAYIIDGKKVVMVLSDFKQDKPEYHFTIWPENKGLVQALNQTFQTQWGK